MKNLFQQHKKEHDKDHQLGIVTRLVVRLIQAMVAILQRIECRFSRRQKKIGFIITFFVFAGICMHSLFQSAVKTSVHHEVQNSPGKWFSVDTPRPRGYSFKKIIQRNVLDVKKVRDYMDSLQHSIEGKRIYDSLLLRHKGILEQLRDLEGLPH